MLSDGSATEAPVGNARGEGYFPRGKSVLRRVQGERAVGLLYGQRALIIGALDARNYVGTAEHSRYRDLPFKRLAATGKMFESIFFGTKAEADKVLAVVERMHSKVEGELETDAGPRFPAGTSYRAFDPELMLWTIAVAADSGCYFYERLVRPLSTQEKNSYWADWVRFGELFGMQEGYAPVGWAAFRAYFDGRLRSDEMHLTEEARLTGFGVAFRIPFGARGFIAREPHNLIMLGSLPPEVREHYGLGWSRRQELAFQGACRALRASRPLSPRRIARGRNGVHFDNVARAEGKLTERGTPPIALPAR
jgi:uncharacterized protein (DUF2236 family)